MNHPRLPLLFCTLFACICSAPLQPLLAEDDIEPIAGIGPTGPLEIVQDGFRFTEGPAADAQGSLFFTDVFAGRIYRAEPGGEPQVVLEKTKGANGLMFDGKGRLFACQGQPGQVVTIDLDTKETTPFAEQYNGKAFNRPNDLVVDSHGGVYFTDPRFGAGKQDAAAFYYAAADGEVTRLGDDLNFPNGIILSPDESTLYVLPYQSSQVMAYPVESPGKIGKGHVLCELQQREAGKNAGGDGLSVDTRGNLYLTVPAIKAIQVVSPDGETLGLLKLPKSPTNCAFAGKDMRTLYITARDAVYALPMEATGHRFGGGS